MIKIEKANKNHVIEFVFGEKYSKFDIVKEFGHITFGEKENTGLFYGGEAKDAKDKLAKIIASLVAGIKHDVQVDVKSLLKGTKIDESKFVDEFVHAFELAHGDIWTMKKKDKDKKEIEVNLLTETAKAKAAFKEAEVVSKIRTEVRSLQVMPPNKLTSVEMAKKIVNMFDRVAKVKVTVLDKKQIEANKMGLLLSVNRGSAHDARVVVLEYKGDSSSKEKTALVGKGITFDSGGYSIKPARYMLGMKFDMSGAAIVAGSIKSIASLKAKKNVVGVLCITDNMVSSNASTPDTVYTAMNGKTVEVNDTDAEGRLVLADGLTYAAKKLKATRIVDVATLTGAIVSALGKTYTGVWSTTEKGWKDISKASEASNEKLWRMPLHDDYFEFMSKSKVADIKNTNLSNDGGWSSSAAMFLTNFVEGVEYIHLDIAGTAHPKDTAMAPMIKTLVELAKQK